MDVVDVMDTRIRSERRYRLRGSIGRSWCRAGSASALSGFGVWLWTLTLVLLLIPDFAARAMESDLPVEIFAGTAPIPVRTDSSLVLAYELHVTNFRAMDLTLERLRIFAVEDTVGSLAEYSSDSLTAMVWHPGVKADTSDARLVRGGQRMVIFIWLQLPPAQPVPHVLSHRLTFAFSNAKGIRSERAVDGGITPVNAKDLAPYPWPVPSGDWLVANGPSPSSDHRRAMHALDGKSFVAQRFALDLMKFGSDGRLWHTDPFRNENWYGYGQNVLAVGAGEVLAITDSVPENTPLAPSRATTMTRANICGNYVLLRHGPKEYTLYAHLRPGGITVKLGDKVKQGDLLGTIGNSGNSDAPHLHFQAIDGPSALASEGIPFVFARFTLLSVLAPSDLDSMLASGEVPKRGVPFPEQNRRHEIPTGNMIIRVP